jgi:hypothetical protein
VAAGGRCKRWDECIDGFCSARVTECDGLCVAFLPAGAACGTEQLCGRDDFCDEGTCRPRIGEGGECLGHWQACRDGLFCEGFIPESEDPEFWHPAVPGKCVPPKGLGEPCATDRSDDICRADLFCDWGAEPPACRARLARDAECRWLDACADDLACVGLKLGGTNPFGRRLGTVAGGRCLPILDAGSACDPEAFVTGCPGSMLCDRTTRVCRSTGHEGDPCTSSWCPPDLPPGEPCEREGCFGTLYCDPQSLTCRQQAALGDRCRPRRDGEDEPCFMSECDPRRRRCVRDCEAR